MDLYQELGVRTIINAAGTYTAVGASKMRTQTLQAIMQASASYVLIEELQTTVHARLAALTHNEAAYICNSCSTGLHLTAAAFLAEKLQRPFRYIPKKQVEAGEMIAFWDQHIPYDHAIAQLGVKLVFLGDTTPMGGCSEEAVEMAVNENTIGFYFAPRTPDGYRAPGRMNLCDVIRIAHKHDLPVLVDAAAQLPPKSNLWRFTQMGADVVAFSGGKDLAGPQASGLLLGRRRYLDRIAQTGFPHYSAGRLMKVGREEILALYSAVCQYLDSDEQARLAWCEAQVAALCGALQDSACYSVSRCWPNQAGQPLPRAFVALREAAPFGADWLSARLLACDPGIYCMTEGKNGVFINPMCLEDGEILYIAEKLKEIEKEQYHG